MNNFLKQLLLCLIIIPTWSVLLEMRCEAEEGIPSNLWEARTEGVALASTLTTLVKNGSQRHILRVYLKNTSDSPKEYVVTSYDRGLQFFTLNDAGAWVPLHDYGPMHYIGSATHDDIAPGQIIYQEVDLSPSEVNLVKSHSLKVGFVIYDLTTLKKSVIESSPRQLTEIVTNVPTK